MRSPPSLRSPANLATIVSSVLMSALNSFAPKTALPTALTLNYLVTPEGTVLASTVQVNLEPPTSGQGKSVEDGLAYVATWNAAFLNSDDLREAMAAFVEKRKPKFTGR